MQTLPADDSTIRTIPARVGAYRVLDVIGRGGNGVVYRALDPSGSEVAVKTVVRTSEWGLASLRAEIHVLSRVRHEGVVRVLDDGMHDGRPFFAMERIEGTSLAALATEIVSRARARSANGGPTWAEETLAPIADLFVRICDALEVVHESGIVHRDLKPANILVRASGEPVIVDFGLAISRAPGASRAAMSPDTYGGTLDYMAPEQRRGDVVDARADLYAVGCMLFELLSGEPPSRAKDDPHPSRFATGIPPELDALVAALLEAQPRRRIGHAADVAASLEKLSPALAASARQRERDAKLRQWLYRPRFTGRSEAIARISACTRRLTAGRGSFVVLSGETGIGKTHLALEVVRQLAADATIVPAPSEPRAAARAPLSSWSRLFEIAVDRTRARPASKAARAVARHLSVLASLHPGFAALERAPLATSEVLPSPDEIFVALRDVVAGLADDGPVVLLFDDLQWADELTLDVVKRLVGSSLMEQRVLVLATCRDDDLTPATVELMGARGAERIELGPLPESDLRELVADMLGIGEPPEPVVSWIAAHAEGNPFVAAEYLRLVVAEVPMVREQILPVVRVLPPPRGALEALATPRSVHDLAGRRLSLLDETSLRLAELVALMGGAVDAGVFARMMDDAPRRHAIADLEKRQLLQRTEGGGTQLLHDRLRVAALERIADTDKRALHREAAALLAGAESPEHAAIAHHLLEAGERREALPHIEGAAEIALARAAYEAAARHFEEARRVGNELAARGATFEVHRQVRWAHGAARAHYGRGDLASTEARVRDALAIVGVEIPKAGPSWAVSAAKDLALSGLERARAAEGDPRVSKELAEATSLLPSRYFYEEDMLSVLGSSLLSAKLARRAGVGALAGPSASLGGIAGVFRLHRVAERCFTEGYEGARATGQWRDAAQSAVTESFHLAGMGDFAGAERAALKAAEASSMTSDPWVLENVETTFSHVEFFTGRFESAKRRAERVTELARERQNEQHEIWGLYLQARSELSLGRPSVARPLLEESLRRLERRAEPISEIACTGMLAEARLAEGTLEPAESSMLAFLALSRDRVPSAFPTLVGYTGAARVALALLAREPTKARATAAWSLVGALYRFASIFPFAMPSAHLHAGHLARIKGFEGVAYRLFLRGAGDARATPYDKALLLLGASVAASTRASIRARASAHEATALRLLAELGAPPPTHGVFHKRGDP